MSLPALAIFVLGFLLQIPFQTPLVHGAIIPQSVDITTMNETMNGTPPYCNNLEGWVGDGIDPSDCAVAISEFLRTNVRPRGKQEYEFLARGVTRVSYLPWIVTPKKYDYGTCDITIVMMKIFDPAVLPGGSPAVYTPSDIATFYDVWNTARNLLSFCVHRKFLPQAGWSITGVNNSIGVLIFRTGSAVDRILRSDATTLTSINNGTIPIDLIAPPRPSNLITS